MPKNVKKVLFLYSAGEFPTRKTAWSLLYSLRRLKDCRIFYQNVSISSDLTWLRRLRFDVIVFGHSATNPANPVRFEKRLAKLKQTLPISKRRIAFFQDEFYRMDLRQRFINELEIHQIFTVAPEGEWEKLYGGTSVPRENIHGCLTGYIDEKDVYSLAQESLTSKRPIDIGYRTAWSTIDLYRLGKFGRLKFQVADEFLKRVGNLKLDIKVGSDFLVGKSWYKFLLNCKYTLAVESGASLLDWDGSVQSAIKSFLTENPDASFEEVARACFPQMDGNLKLRAISPRIFEAALTRTCLILIRGEYSGILRPDEHYIPLEEDFSDIDEVIKKLSDEVLRKRIVENAYRDLVVSQKFTYNSFVKMFEEISLKHIEPTKMSFAEKYFYLMCVVRDALHWIGLGILTILRKAHRKTNHMRLSRALRLVSSLRASPKKA